jgi:hypothetical protein
MADGATRESSRKSQMMGTMLMSTTHGALGWERPDGHEAENLVMKRAVLTMATRWAGKTIIPSDFHALSGSN